MKKTENILVFYKKLPNYNAQGLIPYNKIKKRGSIGSNYGKSGLENFQEFTNYPNNLLKFNYDKEKIHPTQKPVKLLEYLIKTYTNENDIVLDNCIGSGSTAIAAINTNRNYIGFEDNDEYYDICINRIKNTIINNRTV